MSHINITPMHQLGKDERGSTHDYRIRPSADFILIKRKAGSVSGNSYHEGKAAAFNPKIFVLLDGTAEFTYRHIDDQDHSVTDVHGPAVVEIQPFVTHAVRALTDITLLECNSIADVQQDRIREDVIAHEIT